MRIIKGSYGGQKTSIGYLRLCKVIGKREAAARSTAQKERLFRAIEMTSEELCAMRRNAVDSVGEEHGEIFRVYLKILENESLVSDLYRLIDSGKSSEEAIAALVSGDSVTAEGEFSQCHIKESLDLLMKVLEDVECPTPGPIAEDQKHKGSYIYVSDGEGMMPILRELSEKNCRLDRPAGVVCLNACELKAAVALGIPSLLVDVGDLPGEESDGVTAIMDCSRRRLILDPDLAELERYSEAGKEGERRRDELSRIADCPSVTANGRRILLCGELGVGRGEPSLYDHELSGGDPSVLTVTDSLSASATEEEQYVLYKRLAESSMSVTVRLFELPDGGMGGEAVMGLRGAGLFALFRPIYKTQLRALLRGAAHGGLSLLLPSVCGESELWQFRSILREARGELNEEGIAFADPDEVILELATPAAALEAEGLFEGVGRAIIDLDRLVSLTSAAELCDPISAGQARAGIAPALKLCAHAIDAASDGRVRFGARGSLVGETELTHSLIECGFDSLFLSPDNVLPIKEMVLSYDRP